LRNERDSTLSVENAGVSKPAVHREQSWLPLAVAIANQLHPSFIDRFP